MMTTLPLASSTFGDNIAVRAPRDFIDIVLNLVTCLSETLLNIESRLLQVCVPNRIALAQFSREVMDMSS